MAVRLSTGDVNALANARRTAYANAVIAVYTGVQPTNADAAESGTLLGYITVEGGAFTPGSPTNGLNWDAAVGGVCAKPSATEWAIIPVASGTPGWARVYDNARTTGESAVAVRFDIQCGVGIGELRFSTSTLTTGVKSTVNSFNLTTPKS